MNLNLVYLRKLVVNVYLNKKKLLFIFLSRLMGGNGIYMVGKLTYK